MLPRTGHGASLAHAVVRRTRHHPCSAKPPPIFTSLLEFRTASTTTAHRYAPLSASSSTLNPPTSTLPPPLEVPHRQAEQSTPSYLFSLGKAYLRFYKTGLKAVWTNGKSATSIRRSKLTGSAHQPAVAVQRGVLTRGEWQLLRRSAADRRRIPLFALLFALCGEFTPLVVIFASPLVPFTCRIPKQIQREREKAQDRRRLSFFDIGAERLAAGGDESGWEVGRLRREQVLHAGRSWALYGPTWDYLGGFPAAWLRRRIAQHIDYLRVDNALITQGGGVAALSDPEVEIACEERGLDLLDPNQKLRPPRDLRLALERWLKATEQEPVLKTVFVR